MPSTTVGLGDGDINKSQRYGGGARLHSRRAKGASANKRTSRVSPDLRSSEGSGVFLGCPRKRMRRASMLASMLALICASSLCKHTILRQAW